MKFLLGIGLLFSVFCTPALANGPAVVTSIKPVHALVSQVMQGVETPHLLIEDGASPHTYSMTPSDAAALQNADVVFWIGEDMEVFLTDPIEVLATRATISTLGAVPDLIALPFREGGAFDAHAHEEEHDHTDHDAHEHEDHEDHAIDMHLWLDPVNAKTMVAAIAEVLIAADPQNRDIYTNNASRTQAELDALIAEIEALVVPIRGAPFVVFHDAYQYFERRFDLTAAGSITVSPEIIPGVARIAEMQARVRETGARCVFSEPQFEPGLIETVIEGSDAKSGVLDPLGAAIDSGPDAYAVLIRAMATSMVGCLGAE